MSKRLVDLRPSSEPGDIWVVTSEVEEKEGRHGDLNTLIERYIEAGHKFIGFADRLLDIPDIPDRPDLERKRRTCISPEDIESEASRIGKLREKYKDKIRIFFGLYLDSWYHNPYRFSTKLFNLLNENLDFLILGDVHSKDTAASAVADILEAKVDIDNIHNERARLMGELAQKQEGKIVLPGQTPVADPEIVKQLEENNRRLGGFLENVLKNPTYTMAAVEKLCEAMPNVRIGIYAPRIEYDFSAYPESSPMFKMMARAGSNLVRQPVTVGQVVNHILLGGVSPEKFTEVLSKRGVFLMVPYNHDPEADVISPPDSNPATVDFFKAAGTYLPAIKEKGVPLVMGSGWPLGTKDGQSAVSDMSRRVAQLNKDGYTFSSMF